MSPTRREFVKSALGIAGGAAFGLTHVIAAEGPTPKLVPGVLYDGLALPPRSGVYEATLGQVTNDRYLLFFSEDKHLVARSSTDHGRTWNETLPVKKTDGEGIYLGHGYAHLSLLHLKSGRLGLVHGGPDTRPGRDGTVLFRTSDDNGGTWSESVPIDPVFAVCRVQGARVLTSGRIVVPVFKWVSPNTGAESEDENNNLAYTWVYYSDDEGHTWHRSLSELLVLLDNGRRGCTHFEEPIVEELSDGSLLMIGRTELGRPYQSVSNDQGITWSNPQPVDLASAYTPSTLVRIPSTKDLLMVWSQASTEEMLAGLNRHRLSTAISNDEGKSWSHFRNLESLDDRVRIEPPRGEPRVYRMQDYAYRQPDDHKSYPHAPGCVRICYATVAFAGDEVTIAYDYGYGVGDWEGRSATKVKIVTMDWLYERA